MLVRMTRVFPVLTAVLAIGFLPNLAFSQTPGGRTALAAKQHLTAGVQSAMADGKISNLERADILSEAREIVTVKEYEGLKATMNRLSPPEKALPVVKHSTNQRAIAATVQDHSDSSFFGRLVSQVPYIDDMSGGPRPKVSDIPKSIPFVQPAKLDVSGVKQALANVPRLKDTYVDMPTADRPLPKFTHVEPTSASSRANAKPSVSRKTQPNEKRPTSKYADESISPAHIETDTPAEPNVVQQPNRVLEEMGPLAGGRPRIEHDSTALAIPTGATMPDRDVPSTSADYSQPMQPSGVESEFLR